MFVEQNQKQRFLGIIERNDMKVDSSGEFVALNSNIPGDRGFVFIFCFV